MADVFSKKLALPLYVSVLVVFVVTAIGQRNFNRSLKDIDNNHMISMLKEMKGLGNFYFTGWTYILQITFVVLAILDELSVLLGLPRTLQTRLGKTRAFLFHGLLLPSTLLVVTIFWGLWHYDRSLIFPRELDEFFPTWLNHALHTFITVPLVIELALPKRARFEAARGAAVALVAYFTIYSALFLSIYFRYGVWLYPVYKILTWPQKTGLFVMQLVAILLFQKIGIAIENSKRLPARQAQKIK